MSEKGLQFTLEYQRQNKQKRDGAYKDNITILGNSLISTIIGE